MKRESIFTQMIATEIVPIPTPEEIAKEFLKLKSDYGILVTQELYCKEKGLSVGALSKYTKEYKEKGVSGAK